MKAKNTIKLIDGNFSAQDGKEILMNLYSGKINFHEMKNFSSNERFGKDDKTAKKRIPALKENLKKIVIIYEEAMSKNKNLLITSNIKIEMVDIKKTKQAK